MFELTIDENPALVPLVCIRNCDKDASMVAAHLANRRGGVAAPRPLSIEIDRFTDAAYFAEMGDRLAGMFGRPDLAAELLRDDFVLMGSAHPAALYVAECLHASILPLQLLSFSRTWDEANSGATPAICGIDFDAPFIWQWNKPVSSDQLPSGYRSRIRDAKEVVVLRATEGDADCPVIGRVGKGVANASLGRIEHGRQFLDDGTTRLVTEEDDSPSRHQWEWGLPDATIEAVRAVRTSGSAGKNPDGRGVCVIEASSVALYRAIPLIWTRYSSKNGRKPKGIVFSGYRVACPTWERAASLIPLP